MDTTGTGMVELWADGPGDEVKVPAAWLSGPAGVDSGQFDGMPAGWTATTGLNALYTRADVREHTVAIYDHVGTAHVFASNGDGGYTPPEDHTAVLTADDDGNLFLTGEDGKFYTFDPTGQVKSVSQTGGADDPAALQYSWTGTPTRLRSITDPVASRQVDLYYGDDDGCDGTAPSGFLTDAPDGMLCQIDWWDGTETRLWYVGDQLARIENPGSEITDFAYTSGRLHKIRNSLAADAIAAGERADISETRTRLTYDTYGRVDAVTLPAPEPSAHRHRQTFEYDNGFTRVKSQGLTGGAGQPAYTRQANWNVLSRQMTADRDALQLATTYSWAGERLLATSQPETGTTTNTYDTRGRLERTTTSASGIVDYVYDDGLSGLQATFWDNDHLGGSSASHDLVPTDIDQTWTAPPEGVDGDWSARFTGDVELTSIAVGIQADLAGSARIWVDDRLILDAWTEHDGLTTIRDHDTNAGWHRIRVDYRPPATGTPHLKLRWINDDDPDPGDPPATPFSAEPRYDLRTSQEQGQYSPVVTETTYVDHAAGLVGTSTLAPTIGDSSDGGLHVPVLLDAGADPLRFPIRVGASGTTTADFWAVPSLTGVALRLVDDAGTTVTTATNNGQGLLVLSATTTAGNYWLELESTNAAWGMIEASWPAGPGLVSSYTYEPDGVGYHRRISRSQPTGNTYMYSYYGLWGVPATATDPCNGGPAINQGGKLHKRYGPDPDGAGGASWLIDEHVYDTRGRQIASRFNTEAWSCTSYDTRGRPTTQTYPAYDGFAARTVTYDYAVDDNPLEQSITDPVGTITTEFDLLGRTIEYTDVHGYTTTTDYDRWGRIETTTGVAGTIEHERDVLGRSTQIDVDGDTAAVMTYQYHHLTTVDLPDGTGQAGNGTSVHYQYSYGRLKQVRVDGDNGLIVERGVDFDNTTGRIDEHHTQIGQGATETLDDGGDYTYDLAGRLDTAEIIIPTGTDTYGIATYNYDYNGNTVPTLCPTGSIVGAGRNHNRTKLTITNPDTSSETTEYCYNNADQLIGTDEPSVLGDLSYDAGGNSVQLGMTGFGFDGAGRHLTSDTSAGTVSYQVDARNSVVSRTGPDGSTLNYSTGGSGDVTASAVLSPSLGVVELRAMLPGGVRWSRTSGGPNYWTYPGPEGHVMTVLDADAAGAGPVALWTPFGVAVAAHPETSVGELEPGWHGAANREVDSAIGLVTLGARVYHPALGRFIQVDLLDQGSCNDYEYSCGDPLNMSDLDGMSLGVHQAALCSQGLNALRCANGV